MKRINTIFRISFLVVGLLVTSRLCQKGTDQFTILGVSSSRPYNPDYETRPLTAHEKQELAVALSQPYRYFGKGGQAYAFFSADGKYVVKFFKQRLFRRSIWLNVCPLPPFLHRFREKRNWKRDDKLARDFFSYKTAFDELQDETGMLYTHLNTTSHLNTKLEIIDRLNIHHKVDLDHFDFVVQKRADRVYDRIDALMLEGDEEKAGNTIRSVFELISKRAKKGFRDRDPNVRTNCGILGEQAIKIDVGRFVRCPEMRGGKRYNEEILAITTPFRKWLEQKHPSLIEIFDVATEETLDK